MKTVKVVLGVLLAIVGLAMLLRVLIAIPEMSQLSAYQMGRLTGSLVMVLLAFALAWLCLRKRS